MFDTILIIKIFNDTINNTDNIIKNINIFIITTTFIIHPIVFKVSIERNYH